MKVQEGQNMADISIQEYGSLEAVVDLAYANQISITSTLAAGTDLDIPKQVYDRRMMDFCRANDVHPATADSPGFRLGPFAGEFSKVFE